VGVGVAVSVGVEEVGVAVPGVEDVGVAVSVGVEEAGVIVPVGVEEVAVGDPVGVEVDVGVPVSTGAEEVGVGDPPGVGVDVGVSDPAGVGVEVGVAVLAAVGVGVEVGALPTTVRLVPVDGRLVRILSPFDTRTVHSIALCPSCRPLALKVRAAPLVVALLPLLPAIATMKLPFCGSFVATTGSAPKRLVAWMLLT
jgi:hypothetical protein